jgi:O-antigen ligase
VVGVLVTNYGDVFSRFENLIVTLPEEERIKVWISAWNMLKDNSLMTWIFGNGIGGYREVYLQYSAPEVVSLIFPHLHVIELCYENGLIGVILVFGGIAALLIAAIKTANHTASRNSRILIKCLIVAFLSWLIHAGLTFPFYSKYSQYSLAFILGTLLVLIANGEYPKNQPIAAGLKTHQTASNSTFRTPPNSKFCFLLALAFIRQLIRRETICKYRHRRAKTQDSSAVQPEFFLPIFSWKPSIVFL